MSKRRKTDFRALRARRESAMARPELRLEHRGAAPDPDLIAAAIAAGKLTRLPAGRKRP